MDLSVIILNWNSGVFLKTCIESLFKTTKDITKEVIVVDNWSTDEPVENIVNRFTGITLIKNITNKGVGPARNQGLKIAKGNFILILDVDTIVHEGSIKTMIMTAESGDRIGIVGPKLVNKAGDLQFSCRSFPTVMSKIYRQLPPRQQNYFLDNEELRSWSHNEIREIGYVIGACQLIRKDALFQIGLYDPRMFYGVEEIDYCLRAWKKGWKVLYNPAAVITHIEQRITHRQLFGRLQRAHLKSLSLYFFKHRYLFCPPKIPCPKSTIKY